MFQNLAMKQFLCSRHALFCRSTTIAESENYTLTGYNVVYCPPGSKL